MCIRFAFAIGLAFLYSVASSVAEGEILSIEEFMTSELEALAATDSAADQNPFEDVGFAALAAAATPDEAAPSGPRSYRIEAPDEITIDLVPAQDMKERELPAKIAAAIGRRTVGPDGKIHLGEFGDVYVHGMTLDEATEAVNKKLENILPEYDVRADIHATNSKRYYVVTTGKSQGDEVAQYPITGKETVVDALAHSGQSADVARVWIVRPAAGSRWEKVLPVNWDEVRTGKAGTTNYSLLPGDRVYVERKPAKSDSVISQTPAATDSPSVIDVIIGRDGDRKTATRRQFTPDATVSSVLRQTHFPHPVDFTKAKIAVHRPHHQVGDDLSVEVDDRIMTVEWDSNASQPTAKSDYSLEPGDRIVVTLPATVAAMPASTPVRAAAAYNTYVPRPTPLGAVPAAPAMVTVPPQSYTPPAPSAVVYSALPAAVASPYAEQPVYPLPPVVVEEPYAPIFAAATPAPATVKFDVVVVEDVSGSLAEFDQLRSRMPFMLSDTATIEGTLRVFEKHKLVRRVAEPRLMVVAGEQATIQVGSETPHAEIPWTGTKATMGARELGGGLAVDFNFELTTGGRASAVQASLLVPHGQSVVMKTGDKQIQTTKADEAENEETKHAVYVVLTPELVK